MSYTLAEDATVEFTVERATKGRRKGRKCVVKRRKGKRCTTYKQIKGSFVQTGRKGANGFKFTGRVGDRKLRPTGYRLVAIATDAAGNGAQGGSQGSESSARPSRRAPLGCGRQEPVGRAILWLARRPARLATAGPFRDTDPMRFGSGLLVVLSLALSASTASAAWNAARRARHSTGTQRGMPTTPA